MVRVRRVRRVIQQTPPAFLLWVWGQELGWGRLRRRLGEVWPASVSSSLSHGPSHGCVAWGTFALQEPQLQVLQLESAYLGMGAEWGAG